MNLGSGQGFESGLKDFISIPDDLLRVLKLPYQQIQGELIREIAFTLYARGLVSMGIARQFADMSKRAFIEGLAERDIHFPAIW